MSKKNFLIATAAVIGFFIGTIILRIVWTYPFQ